MLKPMRICGPNGSMATRGIFSRSKTQMPPGTAQPLQPHRDVDTVAINVAAIGDHVAEIDADAKSQAALLGEIQVAVGHCAMNFGGAAHRVDYAGEFRQHAVA